MIYKILTCIHKKLWFERRKNINFSYSFSFDDCACLYADPEFFVIKCEYCPHNVIGFARNYFTSAQCSCVETDRGEVWKHCKQLAHSIN